ncbi:hypothetical protein GUITHDRAFT_155910, partial [Guillardia theta CCMP2712]
MLDLVSEPLRVKRLKSYKSNWRKEPRPALAIEYRKWDNLNEQVAGWTPALKYQARTPSESWVQITSTAPFKIGSRLSAPPPLPPGPEPMTANSMLNQSLKEDRKKSKLVLKGTETAKLSRRYVSQGLYERALKCAEQSVECFQQAGQQGQASAVLHPLPYVQELIKLSMDRMLSSAQEALNRLEFDKASSYIPRLLSACEWLDQRGVVYPAAKELSTRQLRLGMRGQGMPQGREAIGVLADLILDKTFAKASQLETDALLRYFANLNPREVDEEELAALEEEPDKVFVNRLPEQLVCDGRTYVLVIDLKPAVLPDTLSIGMQIEVRGVRTLNSGYQDEGRTWRSG